MATTVSSTAGARSPPYPLGFAVRAAAAKGRRLRSHPSGSRRSL